jgi:hypothetical protein
VIGRLDRRGERRNPNLVRVIETIGAWSFGLGFIWLEYALWTGADVSDNEQFPVIHGSELR